MWKYPLVYAGAGALYGLERHQTVRSPYLRDRSPGFDGVFWDFIAGLGDCLPEGIVVKQ